MEEIEKNKIIKSNFPKLNGVNFDNIIYEENINILNPSEDLTSDINGNWYFNIGSTPIIFKSISADKIDREISKLILINQIPPLNTEIKKSTENIASWNGNGFKIEKIKLKDIYLVIITRSNVKQKSNYIFNSTKLSNPISSDLRWIEGLDKIYNEEILTKKSRNDLINVPLLSNTNPVSILIPVIDEEFGEIIINHIIKNNGGPLSFKETKENSLKKYKTFHQGYSFSIGMMEKKNMIKINCITYNQRKSSDDNSCMNIHSLSKKIKSNINGFNHQVYCSINKSFHDGRFISTDINCLKSHASFNTIDLPIKILKNIILEYNNNDEFLNIHNDSIIEIFDREPNLNIVFDVENKFRIDLSKLKSNYQLHLYPPGILETGIYGNWKKLNNQKPSNLPKVRYDFYHEEPRLKDIDPFKLKREIIDDPNEEENVSTIKKEKKEEKIIIPKKKSLNKQRSNLEKIIYENVTWIIIIIVLILLILFD